MKYWQIPLVISAALSASLALADDFKTIDGKEYKDARVTRVEPDGIVVKRKSGISKLYFVELPQEVQRRFNYNPQQARAYSAEQAANYAAVQKQGEEAKAQNGEATIRQEEEPVQQPSQGQRPRPTSPPRYTTVLHPLPVVRSQPTPQSHKSKEQGTKSSHSK
jgi:hypothetical protein